MSQIILENKREKNVYLPSIEGTSTVSLLWKLVTKYKEYKE